MRKFATIYTANNMVINIFDWADDLTDPTFPDDSQIFIDITALPEESLPEVGWFYNVDTDSFYYVIEPNLTVDEYREQKIEMLKENAYNAIIEVYPLWKQLNITQNKNKKPQDYRTMITFINAIQTQCNNKEAQLRELTTKEDIYNFDIEIIIPA